jgi:hypothetical protein
VAEGGGVMREIPTDAETVYELLKEYIEDTLGLHIGDEADEALSLACIYIAGESNADDILGGDDD